MKPSTIKTFEQIIVSIMKNDPNIRKPKRTTNEIYNEIIDKEDITITHCRTALEILTGKTINDNDTQINVFDLCYNNILANINHNYQNINSILGTLKLLEIIQQYEEKINSKEFMKLSSFEQGNKQFENSSNTPQMIQI